MMIVCIVAVVYVKLLNGISKRRSCQQRDTKVNTV